MEFLDGKTYNTHFVRLPFLWDLNLRVTSANYNFARLLVKVEVPS